MRYYSTERPISIGTYPKAGAVEIVNFDERTEVERLGIAVWGYIDYDRELSDAEIEDYELVADK